MVLGTVLDKLQPQWIAGYHEHDSLLEHIFDEELSEEDRKAAWETYKSQMAAESIQYNYNALQTRLNEQDAALLQQQGPSGIQRDTTSGAILNALVKALQQTRELQRLYKENQRLKMNHGANPAMEGQIKSHTSELTLCYHVVEASIKHVNHILEMCSGQITLHPGISQKVESLKDELLSELRTFRVLTSKSTPNSHPLTMQPAVGQMTVRPALPVNSVAPVTAGSMTYAQAQLMLQRRLGQALGRPSQPLVLGQTLLPRGPQ